MRLSTDFQENFFLTIGARDCRVEPDTKKGTCVKVEISPQAAKLLTGLYKAASQDAARPVMNMIKTAVDTENKRLTMYVTDSYRAVRRSVPFHSYIGLQEGVNLIHAKQLADGIKAAVKHDRNVWIDFAVGAVEVSVDDVPFSYPVSIDKVSKYPDIEQYFNADHWTTDRLDRPSFWLNPALLKDTIDASGLTKAQQAKTLLQFFNAPMDKPHSLSPVGLRIYDRSNPSYAFHAVQMPVRFDN